MSLFEGIFARAGLASDVEVVEDFPVRYDSDALRHQRWTRGDWQLLPWILGWGPAAETMTRQAAAISALSRWKMLDNLRRTLSAPATIVALLAGWTLPLPLALGWTAFVLLANLVPYLVSVISAFPRRHPQVTHASHFRALVGELRVALQLALLGLVFRAHQAWLMTDAIVRSLWRMAVSRRHLLEWVPAAQAAAATRFDFAAAYRWMFGAVVIALVSVAVAAFSGNGTLWLGLPFAILWVASPAIARRIECRHAAAQQRGIVND